MKLTTLLCPQSNETFDTYLLSISAATYCFWMQSTRSSNYSEGIFVNQGELNEMAAVYTATQAGLMESQKVQKRARAHIETTHPELTAENPQIINYSAKHRDDSVFFDVSVESDDPQYAQLYLQACMDEFLKYRKEIRNNTIDQALSADKATLSESEAEYRNMEDEMMHFLSSNNIASIKGQAKDAIEFRMELNRQKNRGEGDMDDLDKSIKEWELKSLEYNRILEQNGRLAAQLRSKNKRYNKALENSARAQKYYPSVDFFGGLMVISQSASVAVKKEP